MLELGLKCLIAYLIGSLMGGSILGRLKGIDLSKEGSGNVGGTNALRMHGKLFGAGVTLIDVAKGVLAIWLLPNLSLPGVPNDPEVSRTLIMHAVGFFVVFGHVYPLWFGFKGGKGAATALGVICVIAPILVIPLFSVWLLVTLFSGFVGLATVLTALSAPAMAAVLWWSERPGFVAFTFVLAFFLMFTHRSNLRRLWAGTEYQFSTPFRRRQ